jgi:hypothetical protein
VFDLRGRVYFIPITLLRKTNHLVQNITGIYCRLYFTAGACGSIVVTALCCNSQGRGYLKEKVAAPV